MANDKNTFEIGLVSAGAVSAGAYTAGVVEFLLDALKTWYTAKNNPAASAQVPSHNVRLRAMSGASAGAMCTALTAISICEGNTSKLKKSWVDDIDITGLLACDDLKKADGTLRSVLNCGAIDTIADSAIKPDAGADNWYGFLDENIRIFLTLTNLNGVAYGFDMQGPTGNVFIATTHADYGSFCLVKPGSGIPELPYYVRPLQTNNPALAKNWDLLRHVAVASGAFPLALESRVLQATEKDYLDRDWRVSTETDGGPSHKLIPLNVPEPESNFLFADGGITNNEPFELVRSLLAGGPAQRNDRDGSLADKAVIMIDPFPSHSSEGVYTQLDGTLKNMFGYLYTTLRQQSKFKPDELLLAIDEDVYSRFIIAPVRDLPLNWPAGKKVSQTASGVLGAFGGFFDQRFRQHDYELGKRNCQRFLQRYFILPEDNALFDSWRDRIREEDYVRDDNGEPILNDENKRFLPIIPLLDELKKPIPQPAWPKSDEKRLKEIGKLIDKRTDAFGGIIVDGLVEEKLLNFVAQLLLKGVISRILSRKAMKTIRKEFEDYNLI